MVLERVVYLSVWKCNLSLGCSIPSSSIKTGQILGWENRVLASQRENLCIFPFGVAVVEFVVFLNFWGDFRIILQLFIVNVGPYIWGFQRSMFVACWVLQINIVFGSQVWSLRDDFIVVWSGFKAFVFCSPIRLVGSCLVQGFRECSLLSATMPPW